MTEQQLHGAIVDYLRILEARSSLVAHHSPNELNLSGDRAANARSQARAKQAGMRPGWPDFEIFHDGRVLFAEIKTATGRLSTAQRETHAALASAGCPVTVCRSVDDLAAALRRAGFPVLGVAHG